MSIVNVEQLTHSFGDKYVFRDVNFRLLAGEHVGLVGPNGAGKSTLLKILSGQLIPDHGSIDWITGAERGFLEQHIELKQGETIRQFLRGAFADLYDLEMEMMELTEKMATHEGDDLDKLLRRFGSIQTALEENDFYALDAKIEVVADGLGLSDIGLETEVDRLSGGQRTKVLLAKLLLQQPKVLLLDEPTNYLDTVHIDWLAHYLREYPHSFILISHDTHFMDAVVNVIYHLEFGRLTRYVGNYTRFLEAYELRRDQIVHAYNEQQKEIKKLETYIQKNKARAATAKLAKSREKRLEKIERIEKPETLPRPRFSFTVAVEPTSVVMEAKQLVIGYERALLPPLDLELKRGDKVALVGYNGIGKTTCLKSILGHIPSLGGEITFGDRVIPAYFAQEQRTEGSHSALEDVWSAYPAMTQKEVRQALARCGLKSEHIFQPLNALSGGEQTKVRLCKLMLGDSNWLVLDEPTNHLDVRAKAALRETLMDYKGTVLLVSHEPEFYEDWVTKVWDVEAWQAR